MNTHKHACPKCGFVWEHEDALTCRRTEPERVAAHTCPECGHFKDGVGKTSTTFIYWGSVPAGSYVEMEKEKKKKEAVDEIKA